VEAFFLLYTTVPLLCIHLFTSLWPQSLATSIGVAGATMALHGEADINSNKPFLGKYVFYCQTAIGHEQPLLRRQQSSSWRRHIGKSTYMGGGGGHQSIRYSGAAACLPCPAHPRQKDAAHVWRASRNPTLALHLPYLPKLPRDRTATARVTTARLACS